MAQSDTIEKTTLKLQKPSNWAIILHNDDHSPMDFVVELLGSVFRMPIPQAIDLMMLVHTNGKATAGIYSFEVAEQKLAESNAYIKISGQKLKLSLEEQ